MLSIVRDPTGTQSAEAYPLDCGLSLTGNVQRHLSAGGDWDVWLNGQQVMDKAAELSRLATVADRLTLIYRPAGFDPITWYYIAAAVLAVAMYVAMPKPPGVDGLGGQESPNSRLTGQTNLARVYEALPDVYGKCRVWPDLIQQSSYEYIDNLRVVTEWLCVSRGTGLIESVRYADTAVDSMAGAEWSAYYPTVGSSGLYEHGSTVLPAVLETYDSPEVNGQELVYSVAWPTQTADAWFVANVHEFTFTIRTAVSSIWDKLISIAGTGTALIDFYHHGGVDHFYQTCAINSYMTAAGEYTFTFTSPIEFAGNHDEAVSAQIRPNGHDYTWIGPYALPAEGDGIVIQIQFPRGLNGVVNFVIEYWRITDAGIDIPGTLVSELITMSASSVDAQYRTHKIPVALGRYKFRIMRDTPQFGANGSDIAKMEEASASRFYASKTVPGCTIIKVVTTATKQATSGSERRFNCEFTRSVRALTGTSLSTSRNFGRAIVHMWAVAGRSAAEIDTDSLADINDAHGVDSELLRFDYMFSNRDVALGSRMQMAANAARCRIYRDGTKWVTVRDESKLMPLIQLDYRNLSASGDSSISESGHMPASEDGVEIEYTGEDGKNRAYYKLRIMSSGAVAIGSGSSPRKIVLTGCRTTSQAANRAHIEARKILYQRRRVSDTALMDVATVPIGSIVRWIDPDDFLGDDGLQAGEVLGIDDLTLTTSEPLQWGSNASGRISVTDIRGVPLAPVLCYPRTDGGTGCILSSLPAGLYLHGVDAQTSSRYAFAPGLTAAELEASGLYILESKKPAGDGTVSIDLVNYDARIYEMD
jgi:hypothetical protein